MFYWLIVYLTCFVCLVVLFDVFAFTVCGLLLMLLTCLLFRLAGLVVRFDSDWWLML